MLATELTVKLADEKAANIKLLDDFQNKIDTMEQQQWADEEQVRKWVDEVDNLAYQYETLLDDDAGKTAAG